ncbi:hypothetical protein T492DRAFT_202176 [Pavlovales sp. CCMP2436]|nr:hypothetical protein T492DRAFT_202176 [Pavlovales sp. CCMP2436]
MLIRDWTAPAARHRRRPGTGSPSSGAFGVTTDASWGGARPDAEPSSSPRAHRVPKLGADDYARLRRPTRSVQSSRSIPVRATSPRRSFSPARGGGRQGGGAGARGKVGGSALIGGRGDEGVRGKLGWLPTRSPVVSRFASAAANYEAQLEALLDLGVRWKLVVHNSHFALAPEEGGGEGEDGSRVGRQTSSQALSISTLHVEAGAMLAEMRISLLRMAQLLQALHSGDAVELLDAALRKPQTSHGRLQSIHSKQHTAQGDRLYTPAKPLSFHKCVFSPSSAPLATELSFPSFAQRGGAPDAAHATHATHATGGVGAAGMDGRMGGMGGMGGIGTDSAGQAFFSVRPPSPGVQGGGGSGGVWPLSPPRSPNSRTRHMRNLVEVCACARVSICVCLFPSI